MVGIHHKLSGAPRHPARSSKPVLAICTYGIAARAVIFAIIGGFLIDAAIRVRPEEAANIGEALDWVRTLPFGGALYVFSALGLMAFAAPCVVSHLIGVHTPTALTVKAAAAKLLAR
jgi:hypothetical protein